MQRAEQRIPELASKAGHAAYKTALARTGGAVVKTSQGLLVERRLDGSCTVLKQLPLGQRVQPGLVLKRSKSIDPPAKPPPADAPAAV
ncbi:hypothetical protein [Roseateles depolymerans]|uniref:Uncharacterized protein n=1 Tax=Roseateles depolymerans TaxID=76731 RepID=A0A0U3N6W8_9BURK|nr:hypothetical protein [Roseateles depolymerans]ALV07947.1 hypothetical protein RD2015_3490 [Roseateles depolymerans]REG21834.1 protein PhnA [Roseateles depolymerans]